MRRIECCLNKHLTENMYESEGPYFFQILDERIRQALRKYTLEYIISQDFSNESKASKQLSLNGIQIWVEKL